DPGSRQEKIGPGDQISGPTFSRRGPTRGGGTDGAIFGQGHHIGFSRLKTGREKSGARFRRKLSSSLI
ncbi:MAG TPA: hypothetical protein VFV81_07265, partial [Verrucomicrobiae bacterium]|nr:hypothetical protein [Verrucomicrobiae bacterium]